jgi:hypothetical protein
MDAFVNVECWVKVDSDGDYAVGASQSDCCDSFEEEYATDLPTRLVCVLLRVPAPRVLEVKAELPGERTDATVNVSERK